MGEKPCLFFFSCKILGLNVLLCMYNNNIDLCTIKMYDEDVHGI